MVAGLEREFQRLFFPPDTLPTAGIQKDKGNEYPNVDSYILADHFTGVSTYGFDLPFDSENGKVTKLGVIDIDEGLESLPKAREIQDYISSSMKLESCLAFSGGKGFHLYLPSQPVRIEFMQTVLEHIKGKIPFKGEIIPAPGANRIKVAPCFHQAAQQVSYLLADNEPPKIMTSRQELHDILPDQLAILEGIQPNLASKIISLSDFFDSEKKKTESAKMIPDLKKLDGELPPCMLKFREMGGAVAIGPYDDNNLTLRTYCNSAGIPDSKADELANWLAEHTNPNIDTTKDSTTKLRHWRSTKNSPSAQEPFSCPLLLRAKQEFRFTCSACRAAPEGVLEWARANSPGNSQGKPGNMLINDSMFLPEQMSRRLLAYLLQSGTNVSDIVDQIFKDKTDRAIVHAFLNGCKDVVDVFRYWDSQPEKDRNLYFGL